MSVHKFLQEVVKDMRNLETLGIDPRKVLPQIMAALDEEGKPLSFDRALGLCVIDLKDVVLELAKKIDNILTQVKTLEQRVEHLERRR